MKLAWIPKAPPSWKHFQRRPHMYEDVEVDKESSPEDFQGSSVQQSPYCDGSRSVGDLLAWDEADGGGLIQPGQKQKQKSGVSASQPCLLDMSNSVPHLVKPDRVSEEAFQMRMRRLLQHKYEDVELQGWPGVEAVPGSVSSMGDVDQLFAAIQQNWTRNGEGNNYSTVYTCICTYVRTYIQQNWTRNSEGNVYIPIPHSH